MYKGTSEAEIVAAPIEDRYAIISYLVQRHKTLGDVKFRDILCHITLKLVLAIYKLN